MRHIRTITVAVLLLGPCVKGDILVVQNTGNTIVPRPESEISMDAETVRIEPVGHDIAFTGEYMVSCEFVLTSHSTEAVTREIGFPVPDPSYQHTLAKGFRVSVESHGQRKALKTDVKMVADVNGTSWADATYWERPHDTLDYPGYVVWEQTFDPGETQVVRCNYPMGRPRGTFPRRPVDGVIFEYVVRTGALWKGSIGEATISLWFNPPSFDPDKITMTYPDSVQGEPNDGDILVWHFTDWEPTEDIAVAFTRWTDYDMTEMLRNSYRLPHPYVGAKEAYTESYLDRLVDREVRRVAQYYPERAQAADRGFLRSMIAEYLFYELFARRGDSFMPGPSTISHLSWPRGRYGSFGDTALIVTPWHLYFQKYSWHGGWYHWSDSKTRQPNPPVKVDELSPLERQNAGFLRKFIKRPLLR
jgi:hypothetical protein